MSTKLTQPMIDALRQMGRTDGMQLCPAGASFSTLCALTKRGYLERYSYKVIEYRFSSGKHWDLLQQRDRKGYWMHEYYVTDAGRSLLEDLRKPAQLAA